MPSVHLTIESMTCGHCVAHVRRALEEIGGVIVRTVEMFPATGLLPSPILASAARAFSSVSSVVNSLRPRSTKLA